MGILDSYKVVLRDLPSDNVSYQWHVDDDFFSAVQGPEIQQGSLDVDLQVRRTSGAYELEFSFEGTVKVPCDRCLEMMDQPMSAHRVLRVKLGDEFADDGDLVTVPMEEGFLNVAWNLYEFIALEIPLRHVHENADCCNGSLSDEEAEESVTEETPSADSRWDELRKLVRNK